MTPTVPLAACLIAFAVLPGCEREQSMPATLDQKGSDATASQARQALYTLAAVNQDAQIATALRIAAR